MTATAPRTIARPTDRTTDRVFEAKCAASARRLEARHEHGPKYRCAACGVIQSAAWVAWNGRSCVECDGGRLEARA